MNLVIISRSKSKEEKMQMEHLEEIRNRLDYLEKMLKGGKNTNVSKSSKVKQKINTTQNKTKKDSSVRTDLLGRLTTLLIQKEFFQSNKDLVEFARRQLGIKVPNWEKRSRSEIIGVIIEETYVLPAVKILKFYNAASKIQENRNKGEKMDDFFSIWEETISSLKFG